MIAQDFVFAGFSEEVSLQSSYFWRTNGSGRL